MDRAKLLGHLRWPLWLVVLVGGYLIDAPDGGSDLGYTSNAARSLFSRMAIAGYYPDGRAHRASGSGGLHTFATLPELHFGPLTALLGLVAPTPDRGAVYALGAVDCLITLTTITILDRLWRASGRRAWAESSLVTGLLLAVLGLGAGVQYVHPDALLIAATTATAVSEARRGRPTAAGLWLGVGLGASQAMVLSVPLLWLLPRQDRRRAGTIAVTVAAVLWLPFFVADPGTIHAILAHDRVHPGSLLMILNVPGAIARPLALVAALAVTVVVVRRRGAACGLLAASATRLLLDPTPVRYLYVIVVTVAVIADILTPGRRRAPWWSLASGGALIVLTDHDNVGGWPVVARTILLLAIIASCVWIPAPKAADSNHETPEQEIMDGRTRSSMEPPSPTPLA